ncbi:MAG TPA: squalene/phytoene synthase family protein [Thermohalobaculum sp.]|nr:squalene/phytoene synthase family protein [Thermohalobaculum sp.]
MHPDLVALAPASDRGDASPGETARAITRASGTSFGLGLTLLPRRRRHAMAALYAFARVVDDVADGPWPADDKRRVLDAWRAEIRHLAAGTPRAPLTRALARPMRDHGLPEAELHALIDGMEMDAAGPIVAPDMAVLRRYSRRVAGSVGLISMRIFGAWRGAASERFALALADALQFTNIVRDVAEDARRGRLYLPAELLARHAVPPEPRLALAHPALPGVCRDLAALARLEYREARAGIARHDRLALTPALAMMGSYEVTLAALTARGYAPDTEVGRASRVAGGLVRIAWSRRPIADG